MQEGINTTVSNVWCQEVNHREELMCWKLNLPFSTAGSPTGLMVTIAILWQFRIYCLVLHGY